MKKKVVICICADERLRAGERDYVFALAAEMRASASSEGPEYQFFKVPEAEAVAGTTDPRHPPQTNKDYKNLPLLNALSYEGLKNADVTVIGVGNSTLDATLTTVKYLKQQGTHVNAAYVTHMVDDAKALDQLVNADVKIFAATTPEKIASLHPSLEITARGLDLFTRLDAVPHTSSLANCQHHYTVFQTQSPNTATVQRWIENQEPFAFVVVNAGFPVGEDKQWHPYLAEEASQHGRALGKYLPTGTHLLIAHGGPRNLRDEGEFCQKTLEAFKNAYEQAQNEKDGTPTIIAERYDPNLEYNIINVGYIVGALKNCLMFVANSEGYGTMDAAALHVSNTDNKVLGMFPFSSQDMDPTRQRQLNIKKYNKLGIAILTVDDQDQLIINHHPEQQETPIVQRDGAQHVLGGLDLIASSGPTEALISKVGPSSRPMPR